MEFKLTIGVTPELQTTLEKIANALSLVPAQVPTNGKAESNGSNKKADTKVKAAAETQAVKEETKTETEVKEIGLQVIRALINTKAQEDKRDQIRTLLGEYGVEKITQLKSEQYTEFYEKLKNL